MGLESVLRARAITGRAPVWEVNTMQTREWLQPFGRTAVALCLPLLLWALSAAQASEADGASAGSPAGGQAQGAAAAPAPDATTPTLAATKAAYRFGEWPGKQGLIRPGLDLGSVLAERIPGLKLAWVRAPAGPGSGLPADTVEVYWFSPAPGKREIRMWVAPSRADAQEVLVRRLDASTSPARLSSGAALGLDIGDVSFPLAPRTLFVRGNVVLEIRDEAGGGAVELARELDQAILAQPAAASMAGLNRYAPQIRALEFAEVVAQPLAVRGHQNERTEFPLRVDVVDPQGRQVFLFWEGPGGKSDECPSSEYSVGITVEPPFDVVRDRMLTLTAVNELGLFSRASLPLRVRVSKADE
jgi:hypothetical protein